MSADLTASLLAAVRESGLVPAARLADLGRWAADARAGPTRLVKELRRRRWLTDFQIKEIARGRGRELTLGPYLLLDLLGEGGMGRVYKARHTRLDRDVALKVIRQERLTRPTVVERFHQEIRASAQLSHPNVVLAFDADEADGVHYFSMEYVEGTDLARRVRDGGPVPYGVAIDYARQAALGLQHAGERGLVHRDVKPSNLLVTPAGQVKLLDLGLAMLNDATAADSDLRVTRPGVVLGTPDYLAPEQAQNPTGVDIRADIYALGGTLYFLVTGHPPYGGESATEKVIQHITSPPPSLLAVRPDAPPQLDAVIRWMMAKRPEDRPQTPGQAAHALLLLATPVEPPPTAVGFPPATIPPPPATVPPPPATTPTDLTFFDEAPLLPPPPRPAYRPRGERAGRGRGVLIMLGIGGGLLVGLAVAALVATRRGGGDGPLPAEFVNGIGMKLIKLDGGTYRRGATAGEPGAEPADGPPTEAIVLGPLYVATTETTDGQYRRIMGISPSRAAARMRKSGDAPVDSVTWDEAVTFCAKLTAADKGRRTGWAYRLPTEAEWEYACRAGTDTPFSSGPKLVYGRGGVFSLDREAATKGSLGEEDVTAGVMEKNLPYPAGTSFPNPFGLQDMHGNVAEWCADVFTPDLATTAPAPTPAGAFRSVRGGSWRDPAARCRSAARRGQAPSERRDDVGFRVVLALE